MSGHYRFERELGAGGMATVYLAHDLKHDRKVAIKVLRPEVAETVGRQRFLQEIKLAAALNHPHILALHDSGEAGGFLYFVMPVMQGQTLRDRLHQERQLPIEMAVRIAADVADALDYAHRHDVVHRDIKPENILLHEGHAVVCDFGIGKALVAASAAASSGFSQLGVTVGTPAYMSPEQASGDEIDGRSDLFALGCVIYEMLTGEVAFTGPTVQAVIASRFTYSPPEVTELRPEVPPTLSKTVARLLARDASGRHDSGAQVVLALTGTPPAGTSWTPRPSSEAPIAVRPKLNVRRAAGIVTVAAIVLAALMLWMRRDTAGGSSALDADLVAIVPFITPEPQLAIWREGLAEVVSRNLDGAGPVRTVSMTVINRSWTSGGDPRSLGELGRRTGAASVVSGTLLQKGRDSVQLTAIVYDAAGSRSLGEVELTEETDQMGRLAERFTIEVVRRLGKSQQLAEARLAGAHSTPLAALKAFLQGEYHFRRTAWDSAMVNYQRARELDPAMALAFLRMSMVSTWQRHTGDSLTYSFAREAARLNQGLAPRESLLVEAEALKASLGRRFADSSYAEHIARLFQTLETATSLYPDDRELWYSLGNARSNLSGKIRGARDALDRSIAIDSGFAPAYLDAVLLVMALGEADAARRYLNAYLALNPSDVHGDGLRLASQLLEPRAPGPSVRAILDTASADILVRAIDILAYWPDSAESTVELARLVRTGRRTQNPLYAQEGFAAFQLAYPLGFRGHLKEAYAVWHGTGNETRAMFTASLVLMGALPEKEAASFFGGMRRGAVDRPTGLVLALPWWSERRDTASLRATAERAEAAAERSPQGSPARYARYLAGAARAYLALARADTADALQRLQNLDPADCMFPYCPYESLQAAMLLGRTGRDSDAWAILDDIPNVYNPLAVRWRLERARVAERLGRRGDALAAYEYVARTWKNADPHLQTEAREAEAGWVRLRSH